MTRTERLRFIFLITLLIVLVVTGLVINQLRQKSKVGASTLGVILNQAAATYNDSDGNAMEPSLSDISQVSVSSGVNSLTVNYSLEKRDNQDATLNVEFFNQGTTKALDVLNGIAAGQGSALINVQNVPNDIYNIAVKPDSFVSQTASQVTYNNGTPTTITFNDPFLWGDIDVSNGGTGDNKINNADWSILVKNWNAGCGSGATALTADQEKADFNADGCINNADASVMLANWNKSGTQPYTLPGATPVVSAPPAF